MRGWLDSENAIQWKRVQESVEEISFNGVGGDVFFRLYFDDLKPFRSTVSFSVGHNYALNAVNVNYLVYKFALYSSGIHENNEEQCVVES